MARNLARDGRGGCSGRTNSHDRTNNVGDIYAFIDEVVLTKISFTLGKYQPQDGESVLVQFWAAKEINKNVYVLTTHDQVYRRFGNTKEILEQYQADYRKHYVNTGYSEAEKKGVFSLAGWVFLYCTPAQTQDVHTYSTEGFCTPQCKHAIYAKMGSFAVPVIDTNNSCVGVLEFVTDTLRDYENDILVVQKIFQEVGLPTSNSIQSDSTKRTYISKVAISKVPKRDRITCTYAVTWYCCLAPLFGLSSVKASEILSRLVGKNIVKSTFKNIRTNVGIHEWPYIPNKTNNYVPETQSVYEDTSFIGDPFNRSRKSTDSMEDFGGMTYQDNNSSVMYPDSMVDENSVNIDLENANMIFIEDNGFPKRSIPLDSGFSEQTMASDVEPRIKSGYVCADFIPGTHGRMEFQCYHPSVSEDLDEGSNVTEEIYMGSTLSSLMSDEEMPQSYV